MILAKFKTKQQTTENVRISNARINTPRTSKSNVPTAALHNLLSMHQRIAVSGV